MRLKEVQDKAKSDESGFTLVELLVAGIIGGIVLTMMAFMFTSFVQSDRAARDTVDAVVDSNVAALEFHEMMRTANAVSIRDANGSVLPIRTKGYGGRELRVERSDGTCETWVGLDTQNTVMVLKGDNARGFNRAAGNRGSLILRVHNNEGAHRKDTSYDGVSRQNAEWFYYADRKGVSFTFVNQADSNRELMANTVIPRAEATDTSSCW